MDRATGWLSRGNLCGAGVVTRREASRFLVATVGTDHHKFDRLIDWLDHWLLAHDDVKTLIQHGSSRPPALGDDVVMLPRAELLGHMRAASVIVAQGGPGSIMDARESGHVPIVVPRLSALNEVVDDHQVDFCRKLAASGWIHLAESEAQLRTHLDRAYQDPSVYHARADARSVAETVRRVDDVVAGVLSRPAGGLRARRVRQMLRQSRTRQQPQ